MFTPYENMVKFIAEVPTFRMNHMYSSTKLRGGTPKKTAVPAVFVRLAELKQWYIPTA
jgi:hypothetical protein